MRTAMRRANIVLSVAAGLFVAALLLKQIYPFHWLPSAFLTVTEASLAGGVADWFAVTALFRRPLGFPYHTALIPRNRDRIIRALAHAVEQDFLNKQAIKERLQQMQFINKLLAYTEGYEMNSIIRTTVDKLVAEIAENIEPEVVGRYGDRILKLVLKRQLVAPEAAEMFCWLLQQGRAGEFYTAVHHEISGIVRQDKTRNAILSYLEQIKQETAQKNWLSSFLTGFMETIDAINLEDAATALHQELIKTVDDLEATDSPLRLWFQEELLAMAVKLQTPEWEQSINTWKNGLLNRVDLVETLTLLANNLQETLMQPSDFRSNAVEWVAEQVESYWLRFKESAELQNQAEEYIKNLLAVMLDQEHHLVGDVASHALSKLSDEDLNAFIEDKAGHDLDWIRVNGVVVGGLAGVGLVAIRLLF